MRRRAAYSLLEVMLAAVLLLYACYAFFGIYSTTARFEVQSQNRVVACLLGANLMEQSDGQLFGTEAPAEWKLTGSSLTGDWFETSVPMQVNGRAVDARFHVQIQLKTGALTGHADASVADPTWDVFTAVISWREGTGPKDTSGPYGKAYFQDDNKHLIVQNPVWY